MPNDDLMTRRRFLDAIVLGTGATIAAILAVPLAGYFLDPAIRARRGASSWVPLGPIATLTETPSAHVVSYARTDGFITSQERVTVYAFLDDGAPIALSNVCTHLGCPVAWVAEATQFRCPCHGGVYDRTGKNIAGPPPRPLPRFATRVEDGVMEVELG